MTRSVSEQRRVFANVQNRSHAPDFTRELGKGPPMVAVGIDRTPCPRCGTRADVGCVHRRAS